MTRPIDTPTVTYSPATRSPVTQAVDSLERRARAWSDRGPSQLGPSLVALGDWTMQLAGSFVSDSKNSQERREQRRDAAKGTAAMGRWVRNAFGNELNKIDQRARIRPAPQHARPSNFETPRPSAPGDQRTNFSTARPPQPHATDPIHAGTYNHNPYLATPVYVSPYTFGRPNPADQETPLADRQSELQQRRQRPLDPSSTSNQDTTGTQPGRRDPAPQRLTTDVTGTQTHGPASSAYIPAAYPVAYPVAYPTAYSAAYPAPHPVANPTAYPAANTTQNLYPSSEAGADTLYPQLDGVFDPSRSQDVAGDPAKSFSPEPLDTRFASQVSERPAFSEQSPSPSHDSIARPNSFGTAPGIGFSNLDVARAIPAPTREQFGMPGALLFPAGSNPQATSSELKRTLSSPARLNSTPKAASDSLALTTSMAERRARELADPDSVSLDSLDSDPRYSIDSDAASGVDHTSSRPSSRRLATSEPGSLRLVNTDPTTTPMATADRDDRFAPTSGLSNPGQPVLDGRFRPSERSERSDVPSRRSSVSSTASSEAGSVPSLPGDGGEFFTTAIISTKPIDTPVATPKHSGGDGDGKVVRRVHVPELGAFVELEEGESADFPRPESHVDGHTSSLVSPMAHGRSDVADGVEFEAAKPLPAAPAAQPRLVNSDFAGSQEAAAAAKQSQSLPVGSNTPGAVVRQSTRTSELPAASPNSTSDSVRRDRLSPRNSGGSIPSSAASSAGGLAIRNAPNPTAHASSSMTSGTVEATASSEQLRRKPMTPEARAARAREIDRMIENSNAMLTGLLTPRATGVLIRTTATTTTLITDTKPISTPTARSSSRVEDSRPPHRSHVLFEAVKIGQPPLVPPTSPATRVITDGKVANLIRYFEGQPIMLQPKPVRNVSEFGPVVNDSEYMF